MADTIPSLEQKTVARHVADAFGGTPKVRRYHSNDNSLEVDLLWCADRPDFGLTAYSTVGLFATAMRQGSSDFPTRLEICGVSRIPEDGLFANVLTTAAFMIMRSRQLVLPGTSIKNVVSEYLPNTPVPHLYFTAPFLWEHKLHAIRHSGLTIAWLLAVPISGSELEYLNEHGDSKFESLLEDKEVDINDPERPSSV